MSPLAYLSILRTGPSLSVPSPSHSHLPKLDVPLVHLRNRLSTHPRPKGVTIATLTLSPSRSHILPSIEVDGRGPGRPLFPLAQPEIDHTFPHLPFPSQSTSSLDDSYAWVLDFTSSGQYPGVVISQSKSREIECVLDPSSTDTGVGLMGFGNGQESRNWVDMLV